METKHLPPITAAEIVRLRRSGRLAYVHPRLRMVEVSGCARFRLVGALPVPVNEPVGYRYANGAPRIAGAMTISDKQRAEIDTLVSLTSDWHHDRMSVRQWETAVSQICNQEEIDRLRAVSKSQPNLAAAVAAAYLGQPQPTAW